MFSTLIVFFVGISWAASQDFNAKIMLYTRTKMLSYDLMQAEKIFENPNFIASRPTVFYFHGFNSNPDNDTLKSIVKAYKKANSFNILLLDLSEMAGTLYQNIELKLDKLVTDIVKFILRMAKKGYALKNWDLIGHSFGGQAAIIVGRRIKSLTLSK